VSVSSVNREPLASRPATATAVATSVTAATTHGDMTQARNRDGTQANSPAATAATAVPEIPLTQ
jgi:hypothetical protein